MRPHLPGLLFEVTDRCNLDCAYCYNVAKRPGGQPAARGEHGRARAVLEHLFAVAEVDRVTFSGGEPTIAEDLLELVRLCRDAGKGVLVTSNGNGAPETYRALADLGVGTFVLPCHSVDPAEHDALTGRTGSQVRSLGNLTALRDLRVTSIPITVLTRLNIGNVGATLLFLKELGFRRLIVNRFNYGGRGIVEAARLAPGAAELRAAFATVNELAEKCGLWISSNVCSPHCVLDPADFPRIGFGSCDTQMSNRPVTLDTDGNVRFCNHSPVIMGNIFTDDLQAILATDYARRWESSRPAICRDCERWSACVGGCRAAAEQLGYDMAEVDPLVWDEARRRPRSADG